MVSDEGPLPGLQIAEILVIFSHDRKKACFLASDKDTKPVHESLTP